MTYNSAISRKKLPLNEENKTETFFGRFLDKNPWYNAHISKFINDPDLLLKEKIKELLDIVADQVERNRKDRTENLVDTTIALKSTENPILYYDQYIGFPTSEYGKFIKVIVYTNARPNFISYEFYFENVTITIGTYLDIYDALEMLREIMELIPPIKIDMRPKIPDI